MTIIHLHDTKGNEVGTLELEDVPASTSDAELMRHYTQFARSFMRLGRVHVGKVTR